MSIDNFKIWKPTEKDPFNEEGLSIKKEKKEENIGLKNVEEKKSVETKESKLFDEEEKLKAAEILFAHSGKHEEDEKAIILKKLDASFSEDTIESAVNVFKSRDKLKVEYKKAIKIKSKEGFDKYDKFREDVYKKNLLDLKSQIYIDQAEKIKEKFGDNEKKVKEELAKDRTTFDILMRELKLENEMRENVQFAEKKKEAKFAKKILVKFVRLPSGVRAAIGSAIVGGTIAACAPGFALTALPTIFIYRGFRAATGATISGALQKLFGDKIVNSAYETDVRKMKEDIVEKGIDDLLMAKKYDEIINKNLELAEKLTKEIEEKTKGKDKLKKVNTIFMSMITGFIGGVSGVGLTDLIMGNIDGIKAGGVIDKNLDTKNSQDYEIVKSNPWKYATAEKGDSVWKILEKDLKNNISDFNKLPKAEQTYIIDHYKDIVVKNPEHFGLKDPNVIKVGDGSEFKELFEGDRAQEDLRNLISKTKNLSLEQIEKIDGYKPPRTLDVFENSNDVKPKTDDFLRDRFVQRETVRSAADLNVEPLGLDDRVIEPLPKPDLIYSLEKELPHFEETARNFKNLSLLDQEQILDSRKMSLLKQNFMDLQNLNKFGQLTDDDAKLMGNINKYYSEMSYAYDDNLKEFTKELIKNTGLNFGGIQELLDKKIGDVLYQYTDENVLDFIKKMHPTSEELAEKISVDEFLKARFTGGGFNVGK